MSRIFFDDVLEQSNFTEDIVMIFGANKSGFHGMGMAGLSFCNDRSNYRYWEVNNRNKLINKGVGDFSISGSTGFMKGKKGYSYGLVTVSKPGKPLSRNEIINNIKDLYVTCFDKKDLTFIIPYNDNNNLNKYSLRDIASMFNDAGIIPNNIKWGSNFDKFIKKSIFD